MPKAMMKAMKSCSLDGVSEACVFKCRGLRVWNESCLETGGDLIFLSQNLKHCRGKNTSKPVDGKIVAFASSQHHNDQIRHPKFSNIHFFGGILTRYEQGLFNVTMTMMTMMRRRRRR